MSTRPIKILFLAEEWRSSCGSNLTTLNREFATHFAKDPNRTTVTFFYCGNCSHKDSTEADDRNVNLLEASKRPGFDPHVSLSFPPDDLKIHFVVGHSIDLGKQAQIIKGSHCCRWVHVVHSIPEEVAKHQIDTVDAILEGDKKQETELDLCKMADVVVAVGPDVHEFYSANLRGKKVFNFIPGILNELSSTDGPIYNRKFQLLMFGCGDSEDFQVIGLDIAAKAISKLNDKSYHLTFVVGSKHEIQRVFSEFNKHGFNRNQLNIKMFEDQEKLKRLLDRTNLVLIPSRVEGFGLTALKALSAGRPFLISENTGLATVLRDLPFGTAFVVEDHEDPVNEWANAIKKVRKKKKGNVIEECQTLFKSYDNTFPWWKQVDDLLNIMQSLGRCEFSHMILQFYILLIHSV